MEPGFDCSNRYLKGSSDFLIRHILEIAQNNNRRVVLMKKVKSLLHAMLDLSLFG
jgi:hypothetical protein